MRKITIGFMIFLASAGLSHACSFMPREYSEIYAENDIVFVGTTVETEGLVEPGIHKFNLVKSLKNDVTILNLEFDVVDPMVGTSCQKWGYETYKFWIVAMNKDHEISEVNMDKSFETEKEAIDFYNQNAPEEEVVVVTGSTPTLGDIKPPKPVNPEPPVVLPGMVAVGPTGPPSMAPPTSPPPTDEELQKIKASNEAKGARDGMGFWGRVWDWIVGLFR